MMANFLYYSILFLYFFNASFQKFDYVSTNDIVYLERVRASDSHTLIYLMTLFIHITIYLLYFMHKKAVSVLKRVEIIEMIEEGEAIMITQQQQLVSPYRSSASTYQFERKYAFT